MDVSKFDLSEYSMALPTIEKLSFCKKLSGLDLKQCPFKTEKLYWTKTKEELKSLVKKCTRNDLIFYFVYEKVVVQLEVVANWKSLDSHVKFVNGYLREFSAMKISKGNVVVKGLVSLFLCLAYLNSYIIQILPHFVLQCLRFLKNCY